MTNYLYGFFSSALVFVALHAIFPVRVVDEFVKNEMSAAELQQYYSDRWDVSLAESERIVANFIQEEDKNEERRTVGRETETGSEAETKEMRRRVAYAEV